MTTNASKIRKACGLRYTPEVFSSKPLAFQRAHSDNNVKHCWAVVMGDCGAYLVVCLSDAAKLVAAGYEYAIA